MVDGMLSHLHHRVYAIIIMLSVSRIHIVIQIWQNIHQFIYFSMHNVQCPQDDFALSSHLFICYFPISIHPLLMCVSLVYLQPYIRTSTEQTYYMI